jgi:hypothetical protein
VSTDEASVNYHDIIDNMLVAREWLSTEFGVAPNVGWQLDAFGHSAANALLFAQMGIQAIVYARMPNDMLSDWA